MAIEMQKKMTIFDDQNTMENGYDKQIFDEDGHQKRTGTLLTATAHVITAVIGAGVLSLAWAIAQLGWIAGPIILMTISFITLYCSTLLTDCYRTPDPITGKRNRTYMEAVKVNLGGTKYKLCGIAQYGFLVAIAVGYTVTASTSLTALKRSHCFHKNGHNAHCHEPNYPYMIGFAVVQILLSQIPNFHNLSGLSILAAIMSFAYALIGLVLAGSRILGGENNSITTLTGVVIGVDVTAVGKVWRVFQSLGNIAASYFYSTVLIEIQDTLKSSPPENKVMKKATTIGVVITTMFYMLCGCVGYAAFGNDAPGNFLTGFRVYEPYWLIDMGNICIVVHLLGAYQVFCQPLFSFVEEFSFSRWPQSEFVTKENRVNIPLCGVYNINYFKLVWRTAYVAVTSLFAMIFPFFNEFVGFIGAMSFWPLTVYFPVEMYLAQSKTPRLSSKWIFLKMLSWACFVISVVAAVGSIQGLIQNVTKYKAFS
ncbi:Amino acid permease 6 [Ranunculus cassubicifolius]